MLRIWCMFDNHTFASIKSWSDADDLARKAKALNDKGLGASFFVRDLMDGTVDALTLHPRVRSNGHYGITDAELSTWAHRCLEEASFHRLVA